MLSVSFSYQTSLLTTSSKDRKLRVFDVRAGAAPVAEWAAHEGVQGGRVIFLSRDSDHVLSTGFNKQRNRQVGLWDMREPTKPLVMRTGEASTAHVVPFYDHDTELLYLSGRADTSIRVSTVSTKSPFLAEASTHMSTTPHRDIAFLPKTSLDVMQCEVGRLYRITQAGVEGVSLAVPRKVMKKRSRL